MHTALKLSLAAGLIAFAGMFTAASAQNEGQGAPEIIKYRTNPHDISLAPTAGSTTATSPITYHGGDLMGAPVTYVIWYGNWAQSNGTDTAAGQQIVRDFLNNLGNSAYFNINTSYSAGGHTITGNTTFGGETSVAYPYGTRLSDANILSIVNNAISSGSLPYNANGVYFVLTSSDVNERSGFCTKYCGWHTAGTANAGHVRYSFVGNAARCLSGCAAQTTSPNGNAGVDGMLSVVAHELEEATSDPDPRSGWVDSGGSENADKCAWTFGGSQYQTANGAWANQHLGTRDYLIQRNLQHTSSGDYCRTSYASNATSGN